MRIAAKWSVLGAGLVLVAACTAEEEVKYATSDALCSSVAEAECKAVAASCAVTNDACKATRTTACKAAASAALAQGRVYTSSKAEACVAAVTAVYAERVIDPKKEAAYDEACNRVFAGTKKLNTACTADYDCEGTLFCDPSAKLCSVRNEKKLDEACNNPGDVCGTNLYCQPRGGVKFCSAKNKQGELCREPDAPCEDALRCSNSTCVAKTEAGQPCDTNDECRDAFCDSDKECRARIYVSETGTCKDFGGK
jgi:hypothetical protein